MAENEEVRPPGRRGMRRPSRESVPYGLPPDDELPDDGSAGVREPRRPKPKGPVSDAGAIPEPEPQFAAMLPDPRH
jgi:hypothetical protein